MAIDMLDQLHAMVTANYLVVMSSIVMYLHISIKLWFPQLTYPWEKYENFGVLQIFSNMYI